MNRLRKIVVNFIVIALFFITPAISYAASNMTVFAQVKAGPAVSYVFEAAIVLLLFGGAIYAICKTSYRR